MENTLIFAQTYSQLMNQLLSKDYNESNLILVKLAFELALKFSDGMYRAQGVPLINHLVRTASILVEEEQPILVVITGLLHACCLLHQFDNSLRTQNLNERLQMIKQTFGSDIAQLVEQYPHLQWYNLKAVNNHLENIATMDDITRQLITVQLANELEDNLDYAICYSSEQRQKLRLFRYYDESMVLAKTMGLDVIAYQLELNKRALDSSAYVPDYLQHLYHQGYEMPSKRLWQKNFVEKAKQTLILWLKKQ